MAPDLRAPRHPDRHGRGGQLLAAAAQVAATRWPPMTGVRIRCRERSPRARPSVGPAGTSKQSEFSGKKSPRDVTLGATEIYRQHDERALVDAPTVIGSSSFSASLRQVS